MNEAPNYMSHALRASAVCAMLLAVSGCDDGKPVANATTGAPAIPVSFVTIAPKTIPIANELPGRIAPTRIAEVRPRVSGILIERVFEQGSLVREGDVLYRIDPKPFRVRVEGAKATLAHANAALTLARQQAERQTQLKERRITSLQNYDTAIADLARAEADLSSAKATLEAAELDLHYTDVRAPISGRIGRALITEGALVSSADGRSLATIQQLDPVYADFTQSANQLLALKRAAAAAASASGNDANRATAVLRFDDGSRYAPTGKLLFSEATVDATTGQITLRGEFPNPDGDLLPGMYVRVQIVQGEQPNALAVPDRSIQRDAGGIAQLFVVNKDDQAELRQVELGLATGDLWIINRGVAAGERVVVEGFQKLTTGVAVDPQPYRAEAQASVEVR